MEPEGGGVGGWMLSDLCVTDGMGSVLGSETGMGIGIGIREVGLGMGVWE